MRHAPGEIIETSAKSVFHFVLIKPSHYDDDGYVIQWFRSAIPSNTLAVLNGLALDCADSGVLGDDVELVVNSYDESNKRIRPRNIARLIQKSGGLGLVGLVGVQSNQFPRALDLARDFRKLGVQVCIGGFHVSGCLSMLPDIPPDLQEAMDLGVSLFAGEVEGRLEEVLQDALRRDMKPLYNYLNDLPGLEGAPVPVLPSAQIRRTAGGVTSFDAGRGCPFECSFCTIINVQGRKSRWRNADDVEHIVRANAAQGISSFFITDDNFARNLEWEPILDRLIELRERDGLKIKLTIQVDLLCHKIKGFIEKCVRAGTKRVFIGLESINPEALAGAKKRQNRIGEYREMLQAWHTTGVTTCAGYILGFPADTPESIVRDIQIIQRELPIDILEFFILTPLPGSEDHQKLYEKGVWMDPDMNKYDSTQVTTAHPLMTPEEWKNIYDLAWGTYYTPEHMETVLRRARKTGISRRRDALIWFSCSMSVENVHPLDGGYFRLKHRRDRRPQLPLENPFFFYPKRVRDLLYGHARILALAWKLDRVCRQIKNDSQSRKYTDLSLTPVTKNERFELELLTQTPSARAAAGLHAR